MKRFVSMTTRVLVFLSMTSQLQTVMTAQDWPQWRGPNRDGTVFSPLPVDWPDQLKQKWQVAVGTGHSSPLLVKQRVYLLTRQGDQEAVSCIHFDTGKIIWQDRYPAPYAMNPAATSHGKGPKSTPVWNAGRLYTFGISGILSSYDSDNGKLLWRKEFASQFKSTSPYYGTAMSPVVDRGLLIVHAGGHNSGALIALEAETGRIAWSWNGDGPGYASPIVVEVAGTRQIVTQSQNNIVGISAADGALLWSIPFTTSYVQNIITPILYGQTLIVSGLDKGVLAIKLEYIGGQWKTGKVWENTDASFYMSTPVLKGDILFGLSHKRRGQLVALDGRSGKTLWTSDGRAGESAAILAAGGKLLVLTTDGELIVANPSGTAFEQVRRYTVAKSPTWAHPVLAGRRILVKDAEALTLFSME